ncbi:putative Fructose-2,6-bisphosphatase TIGAR [Hypsibius exemplaris]|uniref:Fructose-2,6-bisphosphatase TIGAR n=1 Tax=Hypsibius exemplaris TaxID=2072580 RepID=A0A1W0X582_HYPEX|nr:putative Fructose-2,6-bisphosphatase TIGAR [Hypsibius exemplaris]
MAGTFPATSRVSAPPLQFGLTFVRHGESLGNKLGVVQGQKDYPLSTLGLSEAQQLGQNSVQNLRVSHVFSSDLSRSLKTAEIVCSFLGHSPPIIIDQRLRERNFGTLEGLARDQFRVELRKAGCHMNEFKPPGGESDADLRLRAAAFLEDLFKSIRLFERERQQAVTNGTPDYFTEYQVPSGKSLVVAPANEVLTASILIFSHGGWIKEALIYLEMQYKFCVEAHRVMLKNVAPNCGISTFTVKLQEPKVTLSCLWMHKIYHESDNAGDRTRRALQMNRSISSPARSLRASNSSANRQLSSVNN